MNRGVRLALVVLGLALAVYGTSTLTGGWLGTPSGWLHQGNSPEDAEGVPTGSAGVFGTREARRLLPEAAGMDLAVLEKLDDLGATATDDDILGERSIPFSQLLVVLGPKWGPAVGDSGTELQHEWWHAQGSGVAPSDFAKALGEPSARSGGATGTFVSFLRGDLLKDVTVLRGADEEVVGTATFRYLDEFGGQLEWTARRRNGLWGIEQIRLPVRGVRVQLVGTKWEAEDEVHPSVLPWRRSSITFQVPATALPSVLEPTVVPRGGIEMVIPYGGRLVCWAFRREIELRRSQLRQAVADPRLREVDGFSSVDVLLRAPAELTWGVAASVLHVLTDPEIRLYRIFFAVVYRDGRREGAFPLHLVKESPIGVVAPPTAPPARGRVRVESDPQVPESADLLPAFGEVVQSLGPEKSVRVEVARDVRIGNLISVLDLLSRAGAASFSFATLEGGPIEDAATWSEDEPYLVKSGLPTEVGFKLTVGTRTIVGRSGASPR